ncbi:hypothetical protein BDF14DRAFT_1780414 [Spinellus fusiger]|nr:hypothetical protein BDF14DRAFT_1780414 [Spinellus fusiger]
MAMVRNKIFIVGHDNVGKLDFVKDVFKVSELPFPQSLVDGQLEELEGSHAGLRIPWTIDTKYYTANVDFWIDTVIADSVEKDIQAYTNEGHGVTKAIDAFVYVFRKDKPETFQSLALWLSFLEVCEPSIRLCIGAGDTTEKEKGTASIDYEEWCLDNEFEYIDREEVTEDPLDKAGVELAVEVLKTNMWDGSTHKETVLQAPQSMDHGLLQELHHLSLEQEKAADDTSFPTDEEVQKMQRQLFEDFDNEDGFDTTFEAIKAMRDRGKDLPDEERRRLAASVAMSFASQMGI